MEMPFVPTSMSGKADTAKTSAVNSAKAYKNAGPQKAAAQSDAVEISSKSRLMAKLKASYSELEKADAEKTKQIKEKLDLNTLELSSEEIVTHILKGTLFDSI
ncbi:MAG TPA: flagellar biosynthesis anti-sigma factor FlgM [bacterium]|nr:flagellar biosynthesis anti-sigma factor FlgM [bacterium]HPI76157.1 flagellar biosynthesis anti-sigma factor FlgM [bacterium]HPN93683.1 flagellar biosynthesis anti-sigma factor FlgM [bacterium]